MLIELKIKEGFDPAEAHILLISAGLMIKSFVSLITVPKGFNLDVFLTFKLVPDHEEYPQGSPQRGAYF